MQKGGGENNSPRQRLLLGQAGSGPAQSSGPGRAQKCVIVSGPKSAQSIFWAEIGPTLLGLSPAQLFGSAQPDLILYIIYIIFCIIYIYIYMKKLRKFSKNIFKNIVDFSAFVLSKWINIWLYFYTVLKYPICVKIYKKIHI